MRSFEFSVVPSFISKKKHISDFQAPDSQTENSHVSRGDGMPTFEEFFGMYLSRWVFKNVSSNTHIISFVSRHSRVAARPSSGTRNDMM